jgi:elongation factor G
VEVERALRVLDGAVLVLCSVGGVQSQTLTVDRQMRRYDVPRIAFINKCDRPGANPDKVVGELRNKLRANAAMIQLPIGLEDDLSGIVDLIKMKAYRFTGPSGEVMETEDIPADMVDLANARRTQLIEAVADIDDEIGDLFLNEVDPTEEQLMAAVRRQTIALKFVPVTVGSALKNTGVQAMLNAVVAYLPSPGEVRRLYLDPTLLRDYSATQPLALTAWWW